MASSPFGKAGGALPRRLGTESFSFGLLCSLGLVGDKLDREAHGGTHERGNDSPDHVVDAVNTGGVDEGQPVEDAQATGHVYHGAGDADDEATHGRTDAGVDEGLLIGQGDTVDSGLGDTKEEGGDHGRQRDTAELLVLVLEIHGEEHGAQREGVGDNGAQDVVVAQSGR